MANPNGRKGAQFETDALDFIRGEGIEAERLARKGSLDEGDLAVRANRGRVYILELKNVARWLLNQWWDEATVEASNYARARGIALPDGLVVIKRRNKGIGKSWVVSNLEQWTKEIKQ